MAVGALFGATSGAVWRVGSVPAGLAIGLSLVSVELLKHVVLTRPLLLESPEFIRFVNPSDYRVVEEACGACHMPIIKAAIKHKGFALVDVISPCVTFNNTATSTNAIDADTNPVPDDTDTATVLLCLTSGEASTVYAEQGLDRDGIRAALSPLLLCCARGSEE